jgi:hypothetical protein
MLKSRSSSITYLRGKGRGSIRDVGWFLSLYSFFLLVTLTRTHMNLTRPYAVQTVITTVNRDSLCEGHVNRLTTEKVSIREILSLVACEECLNPDRKLDRLKLAFRL